MCRLLLLLSLLLPFQLVGQSGELTPVEQQLYELVMVYRASRGLPKVPVSKALTYVAQAHVRDLHQNRPFLGSCNMHSWSAKGSWQPVCYTSDHKQATGMWNKPKELTNYPGDGYEISMGYNTSSYSGTDVTPEVALKSWQGSPGHNAVMVNSGVWASHPWKAIGLGIYKDFAVIWFGELTEPVQVELKSLVPTKSQEQAREAAREANASAEKEARERAAQQVPQQRSGEITQSSGDTKRKLRSRNKNALLQLSLSGGINYLYGPADQLPESFSSSLINGQAEAFAGLRFDIRNNYNAANTVGLFGRIGANSAAATNLLLSGSQTSADTTQSSSYTEIEGGVYIRDFLRLSGGVGNLNFTDLGGNEQTLNYFTATAGIGVGGKHIHGMFNVTGLFGNELNLMQLRPSVNLRIHFNTLKL